MAAVPYATCNTTLYRIPINSAKISGPMSIRLMTHLSPFTAFVTRTFRPHWIALILPSNHEFYLCVERHKRLHRQQSIETCCINGISFSQYQALGPKQNVQNFASETQLPEPVFTPLKQDCCKRRYLMVLLAHKLYRIIETREVWTNISTLYLLMI